MWILATFTPLGWLNRMTQYKDKLAKNRDMELLGLYAYPVLMAADILAYKATHVPVGEDQKQHLELTRDLAGTFNRHYGTDFFPLPEPQILGEATRVMSLRDGTKKMSKSDESDYSRINLTDDADAIALKFKKATTDSGALPDNVKELETRAEADNLVTIYAALNETTKAAVLKDYAGQGWGKFKPALADLATAKLAPITEKMRQLLAEPAALDQILIRGSEHANALTQKHMREVKEIVGLWSVM
jgi:tryptophanyl-tRNA synthetase